jgi:hypothetical protein
MVVPKCTRAAAARQERYPWSVLAYSLPSHILAYLHVALCSLLIVTFDAIAFVDLRTSSNNGAFIGANLTVAVAAQTAISFTRLYAEGPDDSAKPAAQTRIYPHLTAIIDVEDGVVKGITWDDACIFCGGLECDEITYDYNGVLQDRDSAEQPTGGCGTTLEECNKKLVAGGAGGNEGQACDLTLYVVWTGSDADGRALLSSANRFSAFPAQELRDRLTRNLPDQVLDPPTIPGTGGDTNNRKRDL